MAVGFLVPLAVMMWLWVLQVGGVSGPCGWAGGGVAASAEARSAGLQGGPLE